MPQNIFGKFQNYTEEKSYHPSISGLISKTLVTHSDISCILVAFTRSTVKHEISVLSDYLNIYNSIITIQAPIVTNDLKFI